MKKLQDNSQNMDISYKITVSNLINCFQTNNQNSSKQKENREEEIKQKFPEVPVK